MVSLETEMEMIQNSVESQYDIDQSKLFFIIGIGRSGTSILQEIMNSFEGLCNRVESRVGVNKISCYGFVKKFNDTRVLEKFIFDNWTNKYFVEKTPNSILALPFLHKRFPIANYIFLERNPRKILLSLLNFFSQHNEFDLKKKYDLAIRNTDKTYLDLNYEQYFAKVVLDAVNEQVKHKNLFKNQITMRYEDLVDDTQKQLSRFNQEFGITPNFSEAKRIMSIPSKSSKDNKYVISSVSDPFAINMIQQACDLWGY